jgi:bacillithiol system protein YtxJ
MEWIEISDLSILEQIKSKSYLQPQVIFKHSTRCSVSSVAKNRLDKSAQPTGTDFYFLDLIKHRDISRAIAELFEVHHESPQVLLIKNGECVYDESHYGISMDEIIEQSIGI